MNAPEQASNSEKRLTIGEHLLILAATGMITAAVLQSEPLQSANDRSRWATVWSLVERRTYQIDEIDQFDHWSTIDKVRSRNSDSESWHFYSTKPPLLSTLVAGLYAVERYTLGYGLFHHTALVTRLLLLFVNVLPFWFALRALAQTLLLLSAGLCVRCFVLTAAGFGSMLLPYLTTLNNHTPAAVCAMFAISAAVRLFASAPDSSHAVQPSLASDFAALGFFAALTACFELPAAQLGVLAFVVCVWLNPAKTFRWFVPAAIIPLAAFFVTNWIVTGGLQPFYATYGSANYRYVHNGIPSYWMNPQDLDANHESTPVYLLHCLLGHHGLLSLTPVLFISLPGSFVSLRARESRNTRWLTLAGAVMTLITLVFYLSRPENYNYGGNSVGLRWMLWLTPFWWIAMVPALNSAIRRPVHCINGLLLLSSIISVGWSLNRPWKPSWLYEQMEAAGWISYRTPHQPFHPPRKSIIARIPATPGVSATWRSSTGERLIAAAVPNPAGTADAPCLLEIALEETEGDRLMLQKAPSTVHGESLGPVSYSRLIRQKRAEIFGTAYDANVNAAFPPEAWMAVSGFRAAGPLWKASSSDPSRAWRTERAAARGLVNDPVFGKCWHRYDVLYCDELPFGVLQWKLTVSSDVTGEVLTTKTWIAEN